MYQAFPFFSVQHWKNWVWPGDEANNTTHRRKTFNTCFLTCSKVGRVSSASSRRTSLDTHRLFLQWAQLFLPEVERELSAPYLQAAVLAGRAVWTCRQTSWFILVYHFQEFVQLGYTCTCTCRVAHRTIFREGWNCRRLDLHVQYHINNRTCVYCSPAIVYILFWRFFFWGVEERIPRIPSFCMLPWHVKTCTCTLYMHIHMHMNVLSMYLLNDGKSLSPLGVDVLSSLSNSSPTSTAQWNINSLTWSRDGRRSHFTKRSLKFDWTIISLFPFDLRQRQ